MPLRVREAEGHPREVGAAVGITEQLVAQALRLADGVDRFVAVDEPREVELELVARLRCVGTLDLAELALEARVHDLTRLLRAELADVAVVPVVDEREELREAVAVLEAHAAAVTDLEDPLDLLVERLSLPVVRVRGVVREPIGR